MFSAEILTQSGIKLEQETGCGSSVTLTVRKITTQVPYTTWALSHA